MSWADRVDKTLGAAGLDVILDRTDVAPGDSFVRFMNDGLGRADYCLLLWSKAAADGAWVQEEWHTAFLRTVREQQTFLIVARVEDHPLPWMLRHRLAVDLFGDFDAGMRTLADRFATDRAVAIRAQRPVVPLTARMTYVQYGDEIYVTSELFGCTTPVQVDLREPAAAALTRFVEEAGFPRQIGHDTVVGFHLRYALSDGERQLDGWRSLRDQGVLAGQLLWLETNLRLYAATVPEDGELTSVRFRRIGATSQDDVRERLMTAIRRVGLGTPAPSTTE